MAKSFLDKVLILSEVAEKTGTTEANILKLIERNRIPLCYFRLRKSSTKKLGTYIFDESFIEYHEKNLKKK